MPCPLPKLVREKHKLKSCGMSRPKVADGIAAKQNTAGPRIAMQWLEVLWERTWRELIPLRKDIGAITGKTETKRTLRDFSKNGEWFIRMTSRCLHPFLILQSALFWPVTIRLMPGGYFLVL